MHLHSNASTCWKQRRYIQNSTLSLREISRRLSVAATTVRRWRGRTQVLDLSSRPRTLRQGACAQASELALLLRMQGLTLDQCLDAVREAFPDVARTSLYRLFKAHGLGRLAQSKAKSHGAFEECEPGFVHIDQCQLPTIGSVKRYAFVAIDRATRMAWLKVYGDKSAASACAFLEGVLQAMPFRVWRILTDNGAEFTSKTFARWEGAKREHPFEALCGRNGIRHRTTRPYTPKTNGLAERFIGLTKEATVKRRFHTCPEELIRELDAWCRRYNRARKHGSIQRRTPLQQTHRWYKLKPECFTREPDTETSLYPT